MIKQNHLFCCFLGLPNAGKSSLINFLVDKPVCLSTKRAHTTKLCQHVYINFDNTQIIFVDVPGSDGYQHQIAGKPYVNSMNIEIKKALKVSNQIFWLVDGSLSPEQIAKLLIPHWITNIIVTKCDLVSSKKQKEIATILASYKLFWVTIKQADKRIKLLKYLKSYAENDGFIYLENYLLSTNKLISNSINYALLKSLSYELPHNVTIIVTKISEKNDQTHADVLLKISQQSHRKIIVGHKGKMITKIRQLAEKYLKTVGNQQIFLHLEVIYKSKNV